MNIYSYSTDEEKFEAIAHWICKSDYILVAAGAGMSAAAGIDYDSPIVLEKLFPAMYRYGFSSMYNIEHYNSKMCPDNKTPHTAQLKWGYRGDLANICRFNWRNHDIYDQVLQMLKTKPTENSFILTTNTDGLFTRSGFDRSQIYLPHGDLEYLQCVQPCRPDAVWPSKSIIRKIVASIERPNQECSSDTIPKCPYCGGDAYFHVNVGSASGANQWFIEDYYNQYDKYIAWINSTKGKALLILEIGVGFNAPNVLRWPIERLIKNSGHNDGKSKLVRINAGNAKIPDDISLEKAVGLSGNGASIINNIFSQFLKIKKSENRN